MIMVGAVGRQHDIMVGVGGVKMESEAHPAKIFRFPPTDRRDGEIEPKPEQQSQQR